MFSIHRKWTHSTEFSIKSSHILNHIFHFNWTQITDESISIFNWATHIDPTKCAAVFSRCILTWCTCDGDFLSAFSAIAVECYILIHIVWRNRTVFLSFRFVASLFMIHFFLLNALEFAAFVKYVAHMILYFYGGI